MTFVLHLLVVELSWSLSHGSAFITNVVSLNPANGEVYSIQPYVIKFVSDLRQVGGLLWVLDTTLCDKVCQ